MSSSTSIPMDATGTIASSRREEIVCDHLFQMDFNKLMGSEPTDASTDQDTPPALAEEKEGIHGRVNSPPWIDTLVKIPNFEGGWQKTRPDHFFMTIRWKSIHHFHVHRCVEFSSCPYLCALIYQWGLVHIPKFEHTTVLLNNATPLQRVTRYDPKTKVDLDLTLDQGSAKDHWGHTYTCTSKLCCHDPMSFLEDSEVTKIV